MTGLSEDGRLDATIPAEDAAPHSEDPPAALARGTAIGRYMLISPVGAGAMGVVLAAYDPELDRKVALKILKPRSGELDRARSRLQREAQALAKLGHPNVVAVYDVGVHDEQLFVAMEFVEGQTLRRWIESAPVVSTDARSLATPAPEAKGLARIRPWREVVDVFVQAGRGLAAAHEAGLIHRDFKPDNVMLSEDGRVRVMDFGLARVDDGEITETSDPSTKVDSLTRTGGLLGTPAYMSPEQFGSGQLDARSDQFGFCVALYEALYGERPFVGDTVGELVWTLQEGAVREPVRDAQVPSWVRAVIVRGLATEPEHRFESMQALLDALTDDPVTRRRRIALGLGLVLVLVAGAWGLVTLSRQLAQRDTVIEKQASELELKNAELEEQLAVQTRLLSAQRGLRAKTLVGTGYEAEALLLAVQAVGVHADDWSEAPPEAVEGLEQVLAHDAVIAEASHVLEGHSGYLTHAAYSPDGTILATSSFDGTVRLWAPSSARPLAVLDGHEGKVYFLAFSPDGTRLASTSTDGRARIWDVESAQLLATLDGHEAALVALAFSPDGTRLATAAEEPFVRTWDVESGRPLLTLRGSDEGAVNDLGYTSDGTRLVAVSADGKARVWSARTGDLHTTLAGHEGPILALALSPDGARAATGGVDARARLWELETGLLVALLEGHEGRVRDLEYSPDGTHLTTVSWDTTGRVYDAETGNHLTTLAGGHGFGIPTFAYSPDGKSVVTVSYGGSVVVWDLEAAEPRTRLRGHGADVWSVAFAPDGRQIATASVDHSVRLWDVEEAEVEVLDGPTVNVRAFAHSPDHQRLATSSEDGRLRLWDTVSGELVHTLDEHHEGSIAFGPDGTQLATLDRGQLRIWDTTTGSLRTTVEPLGSATELRVSYSPAGTLLDVRRANEIRIFDARTHEPVARIDYDGRPILSSEYWPHDDRLAVATGTSTVELWDPRTGQITGELEAPGDSISRVLVSPDGRTLTTMSDSASVEVWDARSLKPHATLTDAGQLRNVTYSPDGTRLAGLSPSQGAMLWDVETGEVVASIGLDARQPGTRSLTYSKDGSRIALYGNGLIRIHDGETGEHIAYVDVHRSFIRRFVLSPDGSRLTVHGSDGTLEVWDTATGELVTRERIGLVHGDGSITWPIPPQELTRIGCARLRVFQRAYPDARQICDPLLGG